MTDIPWRPRLILTGREFRLPVRSAPDIEIDPGAFSVVSSRWCENVPVPSVGDGYTTEPARLFYLRAPDTPGRYSVRATNPVGEASEVAIEVDSLAGMRLPRDAAGLVLPRRWKPGQEWTSTKTRQAMTEDEPTGRAPAAEDGRVTSWWLNCSDEQIWRQLPPAEIPRAHFVNVHQGCPVCSTSIFRHGGFYPWARHHLPLTYVSTCPYCKSRFPSNNPASGDFLRGEHIDDGYGYVDAKGNLFLFVATYHRDQTRAFLQGMAHLTALVRSDPGNAEAARTLSLMLVRTAVEETYLAAAPQFRYGPSRAAERPWPWGQEDWLAAPDPLRALRDKGTVHYSIDTPHYAWDVARSYDAVWPLLTRDHELVDRCRAMGVEAEGPQDLIRLVEESLGCLLQCILDHGASSNLPMESLGVLAVIRALDRPDAQDALEWLYDEGPEKLRGFAVNDFLPDGTPPEASGGYNAIHSNGIFALEHHLMKLREAHPEAYPAARFPSLLGSGRGARCIMAPHELTVIGRSWLQFGDGSAPGVVADVSGENQRAQGTLEMNGEIHHEPLRRSTYKKALQLLDDPEAVEVCRCVLDGRHRRIGTTVHDFGGVVILRTPEVPERAALGMVYGDASGHRHMDLLDTQFLAFGRPFLTDLGYPQSWTTHHGWEGHWATHNTVWAVEPGVWGDKIAGRGRLVAGRGRLISLVDTPGVHAVEVEACRWTRDPSRGWRRTQGRFHRLIALVDLGEEGVAAVDFARIRGGVEHWRTCRGLQGSFACPELTLTPLGTTVAGACGETPVHRERGDTTDLPWPDLEAMAYMDNACAADDAGEDGLMWKGTWTSAREPQACLDVHQLHASPGTRLYTARATEIMAPPENSRYCFRQLLWHNREPDGETRVDLVFEPRLGPSQLTSIRSADGAAPDASTAVITTVSGREIELSWTPGSPLSINGRPTAGPARRAQIIAIDREARTIRVDGGEDIPAGTRITVNPAGRAHTYRVERSEPVGGTARRLSLDVDSVLADVPVLRTGEDRTGGMWIDLGGRILTRTGNLTGTRLCRTMSEDWAPVVDSVDTSRDSARIWYQAAGFAPSVGDRVRIVDYVVGDVIEWRVANPS